MIDPAPTESCPGCFSAPASDGPCPGCGFDATASRPANALPLGTVLEDQFVIGRVLGKPGGFGITYLGFDRRLETTVAIKEYLPRDFAARDKDATTVVAQSVDDQEHYRYGLSQFLEEARALARFDHPNIFRVRHFFEAHGTGYLVMDYYQGMTLTEYLNLQPDSRMPENQAVALLRPVLDGLRAVHAQGYLHRDIKPANIYLAQTDSGGIRPILLDFGSARQATGERSRSLSVTLTEGYAPFEQYHRKGKQGPWSDIYAVAATLYRMVTGRMPPAAPERMADDELAAPDTLGCSPRISAAITAGLGLSAQARPQSIDAFQSLLTGNEPDEIVISDPPDPDDIDDPPRPRQKLRIALALLAALLLGAGGTYWLLPREQIPAKSAPSPAAPMTVAPEQTGGETAGPATQPTRDPPWQPPPAKAPANPEPMQAETASLRADTFIVRPNGSGFASVRRNPNTNSDEVKRLAYGDRAICDGVVSGQQLGYGDRWLRCQEPRGYVYATLLIPDLQGTQTRRFVARRTDDGFVAVRSRPTTRADPPINTLNSGQIVYCDRLVEGQRFDWGAYWLRCPGPEAGGYVYAPLLIVD